MFSLQSNDWKCQLLSSSRTLLEEIWGEVMRTSPPFPRNVFLAGNDDESEEARN